LDFSRLLGLLGDSLVVPFHEEFPHIFISVLEICDFPVVLYPEMGLESVLEPQLDIPFLSLFIIFVAYVSKCENSSNLAIFTDLLVLYTVKISFHLPLENPRKSLVHN